MAREVGSKNARTTAWHKIGHWMLGKGSKRMLLLLDTMDDAEFVKTYLAFIKYFKPAMQYSTVKSEGDINVTVVSEDEEIIDKV